MTHQSRRLWRNWQRSSGFFSLDGVQQRSVEQDIETPAISLAGKIVEMLITQKTQQDANTHVQHVVNTVEADPGENQPGDQADRGSTGAVLGQG